MLETSPRRGGRPSRQEAEQLGEKILAVATDLFLTQGYGATSIEALAQRAGISKRTFYHRFPDKAALFGAVVHRLIGNLKPPANVPLFEGGSVEDILRRIAPMMLEAATHPNILALQRLIVSEALRFPELAAALAAEGASSWAITQIAAVLNRDRDGRSPPLVSAEFAAAQFMQMVIAAPQRRALGLGTPMTAAEHEDWAQRSVDLFLAGWRS